MQIKVFYSWQSDLPSASNRSFIQDALEKASKTIRDDESIEVEPVIDRDTLGEPGSPDIALTIFRKIDDADIFVCDVSIINQGKKRRLTPNPNVLVELGYAIKTLGYNRIILVMNAAYGTPDQLPFDLKRNRVVSFSISKEIIDRTLEKKKLVSLLENAIRTILPEVERRASDKKTLQPNFFERASIAIENGQINQIAETRKYMNLLLDEFSGFAPDFPNAPKDEEPDDLLVKAIDQTRNSIVEFARLSEIVAAVNALEIARVIYKSFEKLVNRYLVPNNFSGHYQSTRLDYYKFIGHELFVILVSTLIREGRWETISILLSEDLVVDNARFGRTGIESFGYISQSVEMLRPWGQKLEPRQVSEHAFLLHERYTQAQMPDIIPFQQFVEADFFLMLHKHGDWRPRSTIYLGETTPRFLLEASKKDYAQKVFRSLRIETLDDFREVIHSCIRDLRQYYSRAIFYDPLYSFKLNSIGSRE
jgi:hypothetical protein